MLEFLLPKEYAEQTKELVTMDCPGFSKGGKLKIPPGTNAFMIAIVRKQIKALKVIENFFRDNKLLRDEIIGQTNDYQQTIAVYASMCGYPEAIELLESDMLEPELGKVMTGDFVPIFNATAFGKLEVLKALQRLQSKPKTSGVINEMCLSRDQKNLSAIDLAKMERDMNKFALTPEENQELISIATEMVKHAFIACKFGSDQQKNLSAAFLGGKPVSEVFDDQFAGDVDNIEQTVESMDVEKKNEFLKTYFDNRK